MISLFGGFVDIPYIWYLVFVSKEYGFVGSVVLPQIFNSLSLLLMFLVSRRIFSESRYQKAKLPLTLFWVAAAAGIVKNSTMAFRHFGLFGFLERLQYAPGVSYQLIDYIRHVGLLLFSPSTLLSLIFLWFCLSLFSIGGSLRRKRIPLAGFISLISPLMMFSTRMFERGALHFSQELITSLMLILDCAVALIPPAVVLLTLTQAENSSSDNPV